MSVLRTQFPLIITTDTSCGEAARTDTEEASGSPQETGVPGALIHTCSHCPSSTSRRDTSPLPGPKEISGSQGGWTGTQKAHWLEEPRSGIDGKEPETHKGQIEGSQRRGAKPAAPLTLGSTPDAFCSFHFRREGHVHDLS